MYMKKETKQAMSDALVGLAVVGAIGLVILFLYILWVIWFYVSNLFLLTTNT